MVGIEREGTEGEKGRDENTGGGLRTEKIRESFSFLTDAGFVYEYLYDKGSDSSCVYIHRFRRGRDFLDFRAVSGGSERTVVVFADGQYLFPDLKRRHGKETRAFARKHFFSKATDAELWTLASALIRAEIEDGKLFGMKLTGD